MLRRFRAQPLLLIALIGGVLASVFSWNEIANEAWMAFLLIGGIVTTMLAYSIQGKRRLSASISFVAHLAFPLTYFAIWFSCGFFGDCGIGTVLLWLSFISLVAADFYFFAKSYGRWLGTFIVVLMWILVSVISVILEGSPGIHAFI